MVAAFLFITGGILLAGAAVVGLMVAQAFGNDIIAEEIVLESLPPAFDGFLVLFITDIHRRRLPRGKLVKLKGRVDAVLAGGDLTEKNSSLERLAGNMSLLSEIAPLYAVHGNHDYKANTPVVDNIVRGSGGRLLKDENVAIEKQGDMIWLTGVDYPRNGNRTAYAPLPDLPYNGRACRIILVHDPMWISKQKEVSADLVLAGHTHGGQINLPFIGKNRMDPFYTKYSAGLFQWPKGDGNGFARLLISRGFGTAHIPLRWGAPAQIHLLTLRRSPEA